MKTIIPLAESTPRENLNIAFAGHRAVEDRHQARLDIEAAFKVMAESVNLGSDQVCLYLSPAAGADLLALEAAKALEFEIRLILPIKTVAFEKTFVGYESEWPLAVSAINLKR